MAWGSSENRFAIVLIRGGDFYDPIRYTDEKTGRAITQRLGGTVTVFWGGPVLWQSF